jgi:hypothetical protein
MRREFAWKSAEEDVTPNTTELLRYSAVFGDLLRSSSPGKPLLTDKKHENSFLTVREALFGRDSVPL